MIKFQYNNGGRLEAGYKGSAGDCACRAIAIAAQLPYEQVYKAIGDLAKNERTPKRYRGTGKSSARNGVYRPLMFTLMETLGFKWVPTMFVGKGCKVHLRTGELPSGRIVVSLSKHYAAVIDGVLNDTYDCSRNGTRCVYGYWIK